jgi:parvulin-like peptidyl-prolyl isomerase
VGGGPGATTVSFGAPAAELVPAAGVALGGLPSPGDPVAAEGGEEEVLTETALICVVGSEHILAGDMRIIYEPYIEEMLDLISPEQENVLRRNFTRQALKQYVEIKAMYLEFFRESAGTTAPAEMKEKQKEVLSRANKIFFEEQVPNLLKSHKVADLRALEEKLRTKSMSINQVRQQFVERVLASEAERRHVPKEKDIEVLRDELIRYYEDHTEDWARPGRAKWRQLTARFDRFPSKEAAKAAIEAMGNEVLFGGNFEAVARQRSQGFTAPEGGVYDWTTQGALKSTLLDQAIFSIPLKRLSQVIEDDIGFHIVEVLEREEASRVTFEAAQEEMRKEIAKTKATELREAYHKKVMERTVIWTRWPEDIPGSRSLAEVLEESPLTLADPAR